MIKRTVLLSLCLLLFVTFAAFWPSLQNGFTNWDDDVHVTRNPLIRELSARSVTAMFTSTYSELYQPLVLLSFALEYRLFALQPFFYHATNLVLHLLATGLVFWLILLLFDSVPAALLTGLLFGIHPLHVESVAWITERKDVLYSVFFLASLVSYAFYCRKKRTAFYVLSLVLFIASALSKPSAVVLAPVAVLIDYVLHRPPDRKTVLEKLPFFVIAFIFGAASLFTKHPAGAADHSFTVFYSTYSVLFYLEKLLVPSGLSSFYPYPDPRNGLPFSYLISPFILVCLAASLFFITGERARKVRFGALFFAVTILPAAVIMLVPSCRIITADRYDYIPSIGILYLVSGAVVLCYRKLGAHSRLLQRSVVVAASCAVVTLSVQTWQRCRIWHDDMTLWNDALSKYANAAIPLCNRGIAYCISGDLEKALADFEKAVAANPRLAEAHYSMGNIYMQLGQYGRSIEAFSRAIAIDPGLARAYNNRGYVYSLEKDFKHAVSDYDRALAVDKNYSKVYYNRGMAYFQEKEYGRAWDDLQKAMQLNYRVDPAILAALEKNRGR